MSVLKRLGYVENVTFHIESNIEGTVNYIRKIGDRPRFLELLS